MTDTIQESPETTGQDVDTSQPPGKKSGRRPDIKFWTIAGLIAAILCFNVTERLFLDADEADISYHRLVIPANRVTSPSPGDVYVFHHGNNAFEESRFCSLQIFGDPEPVSDTIIASNLWGISVNDTIASVGNYIGKKITDFARVENAVREWQVQKLPRQQVRAPMEEDCLSAVLEAARNPNRTPFVVDAIYRVDSPTGQREWVRFASPIMLDPSSCEGGCPQAKNLKDIIKADPLTRFKAKYFVTIQ